MYFAMGPGCKHLYLKASCQEILVHSQIRTWVQFKNIPGLYFYLPTPPPSDHPGPSSLYLIESWTQNKCPLCIKVISLHSCISLPLKTYCSSNILNFKAYSCPATLKGQLSFKSSAFRLQRLHIFIPGSHKVLFYLISKSPSDFSLGLHSQSKALGHSI